jgi:hypothetical protein
MYKDMKCIKENPVRAIVDRRCTQRLYMRAMTATDCTDVPRCQTLRATSIPINNHLNR